MFIRSADYQSGVLCLFLWCVLAFCVWGPGCEPRVWSRQSEIMLGIHVLFLQFLCVSFLRKKGIILDTGKKVSIYFFVAGMPNRKL